MPSKQTKDVFAIEELVNEIKQNLRLQSTNNEQFLHQAKIFNNTPQQQIVIKKQRFKRSSPYQLPRVETFSVTPKNKGFTKNDENNIDENPYELLQSLLKNNKLLDFAVKRLQKKTINLHSPYSPKQNYFYDSDEERSPIVMMYQLES